MGNDQVRPASDESAAASAPDAPAPTVAPPTGPAAESTMRDISKITPATAIGVQPPLTIGGPKTINIDPSLLAAFREIVAASKKKIGDSGRAAARVGDASDGPTGAGPITAEEIMQALLAIHLSMEGSDHKGVTRGGVPGASAPSPPSPGSRIERTPDGCDATPPDEATELIGERGKTEHRIPAGKDETAQFEAKRKFYKDGSPASLDALRNILQATITEATGIAIGEAISTGDDKVKSVQVIADASSLTTAKIYLSIVKKNVVDYHIVPMRDPEVQLMLCYRTLQLARISITDDYTVDKKWDKAPKNATIERRWPEIDMSYQVGLTSSLVLKGLHSKIIKNVELLGSVLAFCMYDTYEVQGHDVAIHFLTNRQCDMAARIYDRVQLAGCLLVCENC